MTKEDFTPPLEQRNIVIVCGPKFYKEFMKTLKEYAKYLGCEQKRKKVPKKEKNGRV